MGWSCINFDLNQFYRKGGGMPHEYAYGSDATSSR